MGGHVSSVSARTTTELTTNVLMSTTQDCMTVASGDQVMYVGGQGNVMENNQQTMTVGVDPQCAASSINETALAQKIQSEFVQSLKDSQVAMTQWMDNSRTEVSAVVESRVKTTITVKTVQNCLASISGKQIMAVGGQGNVFRNNVQKEALSLVTKCSQGSQNMQDLSTDVANTINQHSSYKSENPFAFIADAIKSTIQSIAALAAIAFIIVIALVLLASAMRRRQAASPAALPAMPPTAPSAATA